MIFSILFLDLKKMFLFLLQTNLFIINLFLLEQPSYSPQVKCVLNRHHWFHLNGTKNGNTISQIIIINN
jgi:hypothetical protein